LDLAQAEGVAAVIDAADRATLRAAEDLLGGHLSTEIGHLAEEVRMSLALVEVGLDFSDQDVEIAPPDEIAGRIEAAGRALSDLGRRARGLQVAGGHVRVVLAGRPNAGKSSLFNCLLASERAIVSPEAGTTRDELRASLHIEGIEFLLSDTAGVNPLLAPHVSGGANADDLSALAEKKALAAIGGADLILVAVDATDPRFGGVDDLLARAAAPAVVAATKCDLAPPDAAVEHLMGAVPVSRLCETGTAPFVSNDRGTVPSSENPEEGTVPIVATSAATGQGIEVLRAALVHAVEGGAVDRQAAGPVVTARHRAAMEQAAGALVRAGHEARLDGGAPEIVALELREALDALGTILGRNVGEDILGTIFSRFCIGK